MVYSTPVCRISHGTASRKHAAHTRSFRRTHARSLFGLASTLGTFAASTSCGVDTLVENNRSLRSAHLPLYGLDSHLRICGKNNTNLDRRVSDIEVCPNTGGVVSVSCGDETFPCDAVVSAVGINGVKGIVRAASGLSRLPFFSKMMNLRWGGISGELVATVAVSHLVAVRCRSGPVSCRGSIWTSPSPFMWMGCVRFMSVLVSSGW